MKRILNHIFHAGLLIYDFICTNKNAKRFLALFKLLNIERFCWGVNNRKSFGHSSKLGA